MVDFRKWLIAFAALALVLSLSSPAFAQPATGAQAFTCQLTPTNTVIIRTEGLTEQVGDVVLVCTGGTPQTAGQPIPQTDVTLQLNTNITSRLISGGYIDALLIIDEAIPAVGIGTPANAPLLAQVPANVTQSAPCYSNTLGSASSPVNCNTALGTFNAGTQTFNASPYNPNNGSAVCGGGGNVCNSNNIFVAHQVSVNSVAWYGVPIDAPGTIAKRVIRMTNVRANANQLGISSTLVPTQVVAFIGLNGSQTILLNTPQQTVAYIAQGLIVANTANTGLQCVSVNGTYASNGTSALTAQGAINLKEGFAASFKRRVATSNGTGSIPLGGVADQGPQNVPGYSYNTESGFMPRTGDVYTGTTTKFGLADTATRFLIRFNGVQTGVQVTLATVVPLTLDNAATSGNPVIPSSGLGGWTGGFLQLIGGNSDATGNFGTNVNGFATATATFSGSGISTNTIFKGLGAVSPFNGSAPVTISGGIGYAVYEVENADPFAVEQANVPIGVAYIANTANNLPAPGTFTVAASFAPLSTVSTASATAPIPRFVDTSLARNEFTITICTCNLLFPFVTNQAGFETGVAIANTSVDPFGTAAQAGTVTLNYYGNTAGSGLAPAAQTTTSNVAAGTELIFTLGGGGNYGIVATPGFQGYIIAQARFQWCHAFAFISDVGSQKLAEGYLAIQLDIYGGTGLNRTGVIGEVQAN